MNRSILIAAVLIFSAVTFGEEDKPFAGAATPAKPPHASPLSGVEQQATFTVPEGFQIELVASEPDTTKAITVTFDDAGRLWTMTALEYPIDANEQPEKAKALFASQARDRVLVFDDISKTGPLTPRTFAEGFAIPLGIFPWRDGVMVQHGTDIELHRDTNGDGKADQKEVLLTGFGIQDSHLFPHGFTRGPGGWIYLAEGAFNDGVVKDKDGKKVRFRLCKMARFKPDGTQFEICAWGLNNIWGFVIGREGEMFAQEANDMGYPVTPLFLGAAYPGIGDDKPKPYAPFQPPLAKFQMGGTGMSGLALCEDRNGFPAPYRDVMYIANPITREIQAIQITNDESGYQLKKLSTFVKSSDEMFRPIHIEFGPDGCLYIVDWYNKVISHNEVPRNHPDRDHTHGRIWRVRAKDAPVRAIPNLTRVPEKELLAHLGADNAWEARAAWHQIVDRNVVALVPPLRQLVEMKIAPADKRLGALWALEGLGKIELTTVKTLLADPHRNLRREGVRVLGTQKFLQKEVVAALDPLAEDSDPQVRAEVLRTLTGLADPGSAAMEILVRMGKPPLNGPPTKSNGSGPTPAFDRTFERYLARAALEKNRPALVALMSTPAWLTLPTDNRLYAMLALEPRNAAQVLAKSLPNLKRNLTPDELVILASYPDDPEVAKALGTALKNAETLQAMVGLRDRLTQPALSPILAAAVRGQADEDLLLKLAALYKLSELEPDIATLATKAKATPERQLAAVKTLREIGSQDAKLFLQFATTAPAGEALQREAITGLAAMKNNEAVTALLSLWKNLPEKLRKSTVDQLASNKTGASALVRALRQGTIAPGEIQPATLEKLRVVLGNDPDLAALSHDLGIQEHFALRLNGHPEDYVKASLDLNSAFTVETWIKLDEGIDNGDGILGGPGSADFNFYDAHFRVYGGQQHGDRVIAKAATLPNLWTHLAVTRNAQGSFKTYLNGELDNDQSTPLADPFKGLNVGRSTRGDGGTAGWLTEYRIWNVERTAEQIRENYNRSFESEKLPASLVYCSSSKESWGELNGQAKVQLTADFPTLLTAAQAAALKTKFDPYRELMRKTGDVSAGKALFQKTCAVCHTVGGEGGHIGPNLDGLGLRDPENLLAAILTPSAAIEAGYRVFRVQTKDGDITDGLLVKQDDNEIVLRRPNAEDIHIARKEVKQSEFLKTSMMPDGILDAMKPEEVINLFAFIRSSNQPVAAVPAPAVPSPAFAATTENLSGFFNGKDLTNWDSKSDHWHVENGEIIGLTTGNARNEFLFSRYLLGDFRLTAKVKMVLQNKGFENSGIQIRSVSLPDGEARGYQADIGPGYWGDLYEENGRGLLVKHQDEKEINVNEWNTYEIVAVGLKIRTAINGRLCVDLDDPKGAVSGRIGFQLHAGGPTELHFKDFQLELNPKFELKTVK